MKFNFLILNLIFISQNILCMENIQGSTPAINEQNINNEKKQDMRNDNSSKKKLNNTTAGDLTYLEKKDAFKKYITRLEERLSDRKTLTNTIEQKKNAEEDCMFAEADMLSHQKINQDKKNENLNKAQNKLEEIKRTIKIYKSMCNIPILSEPNFTKAEIRFLQREFNLFNLDRNLKNVGFNKNEIEYITKLNCFLPYNIVWEYVFFDIQVFPKNERKEVLIKMIKQAHNKALGNDFRNFSRSNLLLCLKSPF